MCSNNLHCQQECAVLPGTCGTLGVMCESKKPASAGGCDGKCVTLNSVWDPGIGDPQDNNACSDDSDCEQGTCAMLLGYVYATPVAATQSQVAGACAFECSSDEDCQNNSQAH